VPVIPAVTIVPAPMLGQIALYALVLLMGFIAYRRLRKTG
jgi:hypothetical protein